jgi:hypothetical protein
MHFNYGLTTKQGLIYYINLRIFEGFTLKNNVVMFKLFIDKKTLCSLHVATIPDKLNKCFRLCDQQLTLAWSNVLEIRLLDCDRLHGSVNMLYCTNLRRENAEYKYEKVGQVGIRAHLEADCI